MCSENLASIRTPLINLSQPVSGEILGIINGDPSVSKSNWLQLDIFRYLFNNLRYVFLNSSEMISDSSEVSTGYDVSNSTSSSVTSSRCSSFVVRNQ
jgi:hypothetical protein